MAGRGTDIALHPDVAANGGLHVMLCQANPSTRIDRQFLGRSARRGEPGSCELLYSADAELMRAWLPHWLRRWITVGGELRPRPFAGLLVRLALGAERRRQEAVRRRLWRQDRDLDRQPILGSSAP
jgi:preprotein translocase subunit SecA